MKVLAAIVNSSSGRCWSSELYNPVPGVIENVPSSKNYEVERPLIFQYFEMFEF